jgi:hypothetical protein
MGCPYPTKNHLHILPKRLSFITVVVSFVFQESRRTKKPSNGKQTFNWEPINTQPPGGIGAVGTFRMDFTINNLALPNR